MPTPMTIEMENEMNKDEIQAALSSFNSAMAYNPKIMAHCEKETIRAALQSAQVKAETVDIAELKRELPELFMASYHEAVGYNRAIDEIKSKYGDLYTIERE